MTALVVELMMNGLVAVLLALTIGYCWILNKRIRVLQDSRTELAQLIRHFDESTQRASASIITLQTTGKKLTDQINERIERANFMADDLAFLIEKSGKLADKLESKLADGRKNNSAPQLMPSSKKMATETEALEREEAHVKKPAPSKAHLESLVVGPKSEAPVLESPGTALKPVTPKLVPRKGGDVRSTARETLSVIGSAKAKTAASLEAVLERIASRNYVEGEPREEENPAEAIASARQREQAEELLALVRANRQV